ncbi:MAG: hypothetical protein ABI614_21625, partial [Planctomycetota bacterium]
MRPAATAMLALAIGFAIRPSPAADGADFAKAGRAFIETHCLKCHSGDKPKAELSLEPFRDSASL